MSTRILFLIGMVNFWLIFGMVVGGGAYKNWSKSKVVEEPAETVVSPSENNKAEEDDKTVTEKVTPTKRVTKAPTPTPTKVVTATPTKAVTPVQTTAVCWVIVDGKKYDVTDFRNQHSGGDIFKCGTDMSEEYHGRHGPREILQMEGLTVP